MSLNPFTTVMNLLFGDGGSKKRQLDDTQRRQEKDPNDRWIADYDDKRRRMYYYNPKLQEIAWKIPVNARANGNNKQVTQLAASLLPEQSDWAVAYDRTNGAPYYYNAKTQESSWEKPKGLPCSKAVVVIVEYQDKTGMVVIPQSTFAALREEIDKQLDFELPPMNGWGFEVAGATISGQQENDTVLFQALASKDEQLKVKIVRRQPRSAGVPAAVDNEDEQPRNSAAPPAAAPRNHQVQQTPPSSPSRQQRNEPRAHSTPANAAAGMGQASTVHQPAPPAALPPRAPPRTTTSAAATKKQAPPTAAASQASPTLTKRSPATGRAKRPPPPPPTRRTRSASKESQSAATANDNDWTKL